MSKYSNVVGFDEKADFRIKSDDLKKVLKVVRNNQEIFFNESHFYRSATLRLLREYDSKGKRLSK